MQEDGFWDELLARDDDEDDWDTDIEYDACPTSPNPDPSTPFIGSNVNLDQNDSDIVSDSDEPLSAITTKIKHVLTQMAAMGLSLPKFLHAISWGDPGCVADSQVRGARTVLMNSKELPLILHNWWKPPRSAASHKSRTKAANNIMENFAHKCLRSVLDQELDMVSEILKSLDDVSEEFYTSTKFGDLAREFEEVAPTLWTLLRKSAYTDKQEKRNSRKNPDKFRGLSAKAFDTLHALAITMSHKWTADHVAKLSAAAMKEVTELMELFPWLISYDNINIPFRVFSQRLDNKDKFGSGVAATVSYPHVHRRTIYEVLQILLMSPEFDFKTYTGCDSPLLHPPPSVHALPHGPEHATQQYMLGSVNIPEQSYADNERVVDELLHQLGLSGALEKEQRLALEKIIVWLGDQLTVERLRGLFKYRSQDANSFDRLDWTVLMYGWLHLQMVFANSLHKQYLGTTAGRGLMQAFTLLGRKGLGSVSTRGPFHHHLKEALTHVAEAHLRLDWLAVGSVDDLAELRNCTPDELVALAERLVNEHASSDALEVMDSRPEEERDEIKRSTILWNRDVLHYIVLDESIKNGDVGLMEAMLPMLLYRFTGGRNSKYAIEVLELLQGLHKEWPPAVCNFMQEHGWLVNFEGKRNSFLPIDMAQEHNIKDIKVTYKSEGPNIQWEYFKKLHPALRVIRQLGKHMENEFNTVTCGMKHGVPKKDADIILLQSSYYAAKVHEDIPGRQRVGSKHDKVVDIISKGAIKLQTSCTIQRWQAARNFRRSHEEDWEDISNGNGDE
ncbi:hypothetical protein PAXINDRAFT_182682 [Paxillus involutus ATCC 200175]|uniref:Unplaced genomic scaffold PAXINscaffold_994, whole genome shotgun sequence n=1 Tax=Paxillus involutus ATCC 200175 TaxID=664439 RepID=A0A0C9TGP6_PAXIN|nr:hypothetical protein PAXINDRAFT_182682 [Paxillus involutus ATCC 200175]